MTLLDFARGPALQWSLIILVAGTLWRLLGALLIRRETDLSQPRSDATVSGGVRTMFSRFVPRKEFHDNAMLAVVLGFVMHIGLAIVVFLFTPHILFFDSVFGVSWPGLPSNLVMAAGVLTVASLVALLVRRWNTPLLKMISSADDYISLLVTLIPVVTGMMAYAHVGGPYQTVLAIHILSVEAMLIWFPFGKLFHAVAWIPSRAQLGATLQRRGVKA
ncbi:MAG: nitrate reductase [Gammaproteobacteria bacterium]|nr:nitrate reductase [Gammaproteobacteria bacterium]